MSDHEPSAESTPRYEVRLSGRILIRGGTEQPCLFESVQGREALFRTAFPGMPGQRGTAVAYVDLVGRIEGSSINVDHGQIAVTIAAPDAKLARLRQQFALLASMPDADRKELRGHRRISPDRQAVMIQLPNGLSVDGELRDLSRSGAAVDSDAMVVLGDKVVLGQTRGRVARLFEGGFAIQFARLLPLERFSTSFVL